MEKALKRTVYIDNQGKIQLGRQGESGVLQVVFVRAVAVDGGEWTLLHRRSADEEPYPVPLSMSDTGGVWEVTASDTAYSGYGEAQLICATEGGKILKSYIFHTVVEKSLQTRETAPDPANPWYLEILDRLNNKEAPTAEEISAVFALSGEDAETVQAALDLLSAKLEAAGSGTVKSVNGVEPDEDGDVDIEPTDEEALVLLAECGVVTPACASDGTVYTLNDKIVTI